jgi:peptidoglycan/LPS O-acetylase OafA/YrhL
MQTTLLIVLSLSAVTYALIEKPGQKLGAAIIAALRARRPSPIAQSPALQLESAAQLLHPRPG